MGKIVIIMVVIITAIIGTIMVSVNSRSEEVPETLAGNYQDIGSYALQYAINQVSSEQVTDNNTVSYNEAEFEVLSGQVNSIAYTFNRDTVVITEEGNEDDTGGVNTINGSLNINPSNSSNNEFYMVLPDGTIIDRDEVHKNAPMFGYNGSATLVKVKPKAQGRTLTINGASITLRTNTRYTISSSNMTVNLYNTKEKKGKAMGQWWIDIDATGATIDPDPGGIPEVGGATEGESDTLEVLTSVEILANVSMNVNGKDITHDSRAVLENIATDFSEMWTFPEKTVWAVNDETPPLLHYYILSEGEEGEVLSNEDFVYLEGTITGISEANVDIEALTIGPDGVIYFINNQKNSGGYSVSYKIDPNNPTNNIDRDPDTNVIATRLEAYSNLTNSTKELTNLEFIDGKIYTISKKDKKIYSISPDDGTLTFVCNLNVNGAFRTDALTKAADGYVYLDKTKSSNSELWKFTEFPAGEIEKVCTITGSGKVEALAANPDGTIYAADDESWYKIDPTNGDVEKVVDYEFDIEGIDFYYEAELVKYGDPVLKIVYWNP